MIEIEILKNRNKYVAKWNFDIIVWNEKIENSVIFDAYQRQL